MKNTPLNEMTKEQRIVHYATAPRVSAGRLSQIVGRTTVHFWVGRVRGKFVVGPNGKYRHTKREEAIASARWFRAKCVEDAKRLGLISDGATTPHTRPAAGPRP